MSDLDGQALELSNEQRREIIEQALNDENVPKIYGNGFIIGLSTSDSYLLLQHHAKPVAFISLSFTSAKTLVEKLGHAIATLEDKTQQSIMTTDDILIGLQAMGGEEE